MTEAQLQSQIIKFLKDHGCYVIKTKPGPGIPVGCPDIIALHAKNWWAIEVKRSDTAKFQAGQEATLNYLMQHNIGRVLVICPENFDEMKQYLSLRIPY